MPEPADELERILGEAQARLSNIHLELPTLESGGPAPPSPEEWAAESLAGVAPPRPARKMPPPPLMVLAREAALDVVSLPDSPAEPPALPSVELPAEPAPLAPSASAHELPPAARELPSTPAERAVPAAAFASPARARSFSRPMRPLILAAAALAAAGGIWWSLPSAPARQALQLASFDALAARGDSQWLIARQRDLLQHDAAQTLKVLLRLPRPLNSILWTEGTLYGSDGINTLFRWEKLDGPPQTFALDHAPVAIFARAPHIWTLDEGGNLSQFLFSRSMTGVFLQPLDLSKIGMSGDFSMTENGTLILLERSSGNLLRLTRNKSTYAVTARGPSYGAGARLLPSERGLWIARAQGDKTSLILVPAPK